MSFEKDTKEEILLTIAIPTYNRPKTLEKILVQLSEENNQNYYVLIADDYNGPSSETREMVEKYQKANPRITYIKNLSNLGFSGNVLHLYETVQTRYVWYICDDEILLKGCVDTILQAINTYKPRVAYFGFTQVDPFGREIVVPPGKESFFNDYDRFADHDLLLQGSLLSIVVFEKTNIVLDKIKAANYRDNVFIQFTFVLNLLSDRFSFSIIPTPVVHRNVGYKYGDFYKFNLVDGLKAVTATEHKFDNKQFIRFYVRHIPTNFLLFLSQKLGLYRFTFHPSKQTIVYILTYYRFFSVFIFLMPVVGFLIPGFFIKAAYFLRLTMLHGYEKAKFVYKTNVNRAYTDTRDTGYTTYR
jgi:glycosyltransferase involved in cell wall biosynthesis